MFGSRLKASIGVPPQSTQAQNTQTPKKPKPEIPKVP